MDQVVEINKEKSQFDMYNDVIDIDTSPIDMKFRLHFWKKKVKQFPLLSELAKRFLGIPASSAPSERVWSLASLLSN